MPYNLMKRVNNVATMFATLLAVIAFVGIIAVFPDLFSIHEMLFQIIAVLLAVWCTAVVTNVLLTGQTNKEEAREKNIKVHENKITVYADFVSKMWATMSDGQVEPNEIIGIRSEVFNKLIFYLKDTQVKAISVALKDLSEDSVGDQYIKVFQEITTILRDDIMENTEKTEGNDLLTLWNRFNELLPKPAEEVPAHITESKEEKPVESVQGEVEAASANKYLKNTCVHFNILSVEWQYKLFSNGAQALALCEYGESWRTNLIKRCGFNDVVFLYKTGGPGYVGAFLAKGWIVFEADGLGKLQKVVKCVFSESGKKTEVLSETEWNENINHYEVQGYIDDGCTLISYLLVEPLVYYEKGVSCISVYRRTISAYDNGYAWTTLARFKSVLETEPKEEINSYTFNNETKRFQVNEEALNELFTSNHIIASKKDANGWWID